VENQPAAKIDGSKPNALNHFRRLSIMMSWICVATLAALSLVPGDERPHTGYSGRFEHFLAYFLTALPVWFACISWRSKARALLGLSAMAGGFEILQIWIPGRSAAVLDWAVSTAGALTGMLLASGVFLLLVGRSGKWTTASSGTSREDGRPFERVVK
jgi:VanZ family protein